MSEVHCNSVSTCEFESGHLDPAAEWQLVSSKSSSFSSVLPCIHSSTKAVLRLNVMERLKKRGVKWTGDDFHVQLKIGGGSGLVCCFQAMARESLLVALSPTPNYSNKYLEMMQVEFGSDGNTRTTLRAGRQVVVSPLCRVAQERAWTSYWVCYYPQPNNKGGKLYAGVGLVPGEDTVAILDVQHNQKKEQPGEKKDDGGGPADDREEAEPSKSEEAEPKVDALSLSSSSPLPKVFYVGFGNGGGDRRSAGTALNIRHIRLSHMPDSLQSKLDNLSPESLPMVTVGQKDDPETAALFEEYQLECEKQRSRAKKFGIEYKEPPMTAFTTWSEARRLQLNPTEGFVTGINLMSAEEIAKQEARKARFGGSVDAAKQAEGDQHEQVQESLDVEQAWDNDDKAHSQRIDPPPNLWKTPPDENDAIEEDDPASLVEEKIHVFSNDWAPFKQIRTNDLMQHFTDYGPSYVEWLGDLSCNIHFQDKFTAARALHNLAQEIPSPPPESIVSATSPSAFADFGDDEVPDLGRMGWRFGKTMLRKISNDRFGRRGTTARLLMRVATSLDILQEKPTTWPKPPKGFSTKRVLGPNRYMPQHQRGTKRDIAEQQQQQKQQQRRQEVEWNPLSGDDHPLLSRGLAAGRGNGYSAEELEAERAKKRAKVETTNEEAT